MHQSRLMAVMARREEETALSGRVEMDDADLGGVRSGGKRGRGAAGKGSRKREIARGAKHWLAPGAAVVTDGLGCWSALDEIACSHQAIRTGSGRQAARMAPFKWVNTMLGNIKCAITGTYRQLGPDHAGRYLASFAWRYNRRYQLETMIPRFVHSAARTEPMPYRLLIAGLLSGISRYSFDAHVSVANFTVLSSAAFSFHSVELATAETKATSSNRTLSSIVFSSRKRLLPTYFPPIYAPWLIPMRARYLSSIENFANPSASATVAPL